MAGWLSLALQGSLEVGYGGPVLSQPPDDVMGVGLEKRETGIRKISKKMKK